MLFSDLVFITSDPQSLNRCDKSHLFRESFMLFNHFLIILLQIFIVEIMQEMGF